MTSTSIDALFKNVECIGAVGAAARARRASKSPCWRRCTGFKRSRCSKSNGWQNAKKKRGELHVS